MRDPFPVSAALPLLSLTVIGATEAATLHVPGDYPAIQAALDVATDGDSVLVAPGVYSGPDNIFLDYSGKGLILLSESGPDVTIIDVGSAGIGVLFNDDETSAARLEGFTIRNGGNGIVCQVSSPTITDCVIQDCDVGTLGAGIYLGYSAAAVSDCTVRDNSSLRGGGIHLQGSSATVSHCTISGNTAATDGGGIGIAGGGGGPRISDCFILGNSAGENGGGVYIENSSPTIENCVVADDSCGVAGGGFYAIDSGNVKIRGTVISGNTAAQGGGAYIRETDPITFTSCTISGNRADDGGGLYGLLYSTLRVEQTILWSNCSDLGGAESYLSPTSEMWLTCSDIDTAEVEGDTVFFDQQIFSDPLFCDPAPCESAPTVEGDHTLQAGSPCLPENSPCGEPVGALPEGCPAAGAPDGPSPRVPARLSFASFPNPSTGRMALRVEAPAREHVVIRLHDVRGRLVETLVDRDLGAGQHSFVIDLDAVVAGRLSAGTYYLRLAGETRRKSRKVMVLR